MQTGVVVLNNEDINKPVGCMIHKEDSILSYFHKEIINVYSSNKVGFCGSEPLLFKEGAHLNAYYGYSPEMSSIANTILLSWLNHYKTTLKSFDILMLNHRQKNLGLQITS